jgi:hypothetical protein
MLTFFGQVALSAEHDTHSCATEKPKGIRDLR